jgi:hypothetical protein
MAAETDEKNAAVIAEAEHPARKFYGFAGVGGAKLIAGVRTVRMHF